MTVTFDIRQAERGDIAHDKQNLRYGQVFFLKNIRTSKLEGPYQVSYHTNVDDLATWLKLKMIYVPVNAIDNTVRVITE